MKVLRIRFINHGLWYFIQGSFEESWKINCVHYYNNQVFETQDNDERYRCWIATCGFSLSLYAWLNYRVLAYTVPAAQSKTVITYSLGFKTHHARTCRKNSCISSSVQRWWRSHGFDGWLMSAQWTIRDSAFVLSMLQPQRHCIIVKDARTDGGYIRSGLPSKNISKIVILARYI